MALIHGSGTVYVSEIVEQSDIESFIKEIFPVLFVHPSIHLTGLAALALLSLFMKNEAEKILFYIAVFVIMDAVLAFYLGAIIPGIIAVVSSLMFVFSGSKYSK